MPRYTKNGGKLGYRKKYRKQKHKAIAGILTNLSRTEFRILQEIAKHGMGLYTPYRELLSKHPKHKVKPSSFEKYATARNQDILAEHILREEEEHNDHLSETHYGGGLQDAHNAVADWAYDLAMEGGSEYVANWAVDQLDPDTSEDHRKLAAQGVRWAAEQGIDYYMREDDDDEVVVEYADQINPGEIPNHEWIDHILEHQQQEPQQQSTFVTVGNAIFDTANWIGDILGATADLLSEHPTDSPYDYPRDV